MSGSLPVIPHSSVQLTEQDRIQARQTAEQLSREHDRLTPDPLFAELHVSGATDGRALHCDDLSEIQVAPGKCGIEAFQERARLRATDGDILATAYFPNPLYAEYCRETLGLGDVQWLTPECPHSPLRLTEACWEDREARRRLVYAIRHENLQFLHPHQGTDAAWRLALLLSQKARRPLQVIAAPPGLNRFVNDKGHFAKLVQRLFGPRSTPPTDVVWSRSMAADRVRRFAEAGASVALKLPSSAGGEGNLNLPMSRIRERTTSEIERVLHELLDRVGYESGDELLATVWESNVLSAPSAQIWIPPANAGDPILEGFFQQFIVEVQGSFAGAIPAQLPEHLTELTSRRCLLLATIFQQLGYVGRCSFDLVLTGKSPETAQMEFIECNGRWGGTSLPMTLMNRLFGDWQSQPFSSHVLKIRGCGRIPWQTWIQQLGSKVYDCRTGTGTLFVLHPEVLAHHDQLTVIALGADCAAAEASVRTDFLQWVGQILGQNAADPLMLAATIQNNDE